MFAFVLAAASVTAPPTTYEVVNLVPSQRYVVVNLVPPKADAVIVTEFLAPQPTSTATVCVGGQCGVSVFQGIGTVRGFAGTSRPIARGFGIFRRR